MLAKLFSALNLRAGERGLTAMMAAYHFLIMGTYYLLKPAQESLFLVRLGADKLPFVFILAAVAVVPVTAGLARIGQRTTTTRLIVITNLLLVGLLALFWWLLVAVDQRWVYYAFDVFVNIFGLLTTSQFWLLANTAYDVGQAKRLFGWLNFAAILGAVVGGGVTSLLVDDLRVNTATLPLYCGGLLVLCSLLVVTLRRRYPGTAEAPTRSGRRQRESVRRMLGTIRKSPHLSLIVALLATTMLTVTFVDFIFKDVAAQAYPVQKELTAFFGQFYGGMNLLSLAFQVFVTTRLLRWLGVGGVVLLLPSALLLGAGAMIVMPGLLASILLRGADTGLKHSVDRTGRELLFLPVPIQVKKRVKVFVDTFVDRWFRGFAGVLLLLMVNVWHFSPRALGAVVFGLALVWVGLAWRTKKSYVGAFREALERQEMDASDLRMDISEGEAVRALIRTLEEGSRRQQLYALDMLTAVRDPQLPPVLRPLLYDADAGIRHRALAVLTAQHSPDCLADAETLLDDPDPDVRVEAVRLLLDHRMDRPRLDLLSDLLRHENVRAQAAAVGFIASYGRSGERALLDPDAIAHLLQKVPEERVSTRVQLARAVGVLDDPAFYDARSDVLIQLLADPHPDVVSAAIEGMGRSRDPIFIPFLLSKLNDKPFRGAVHHALAAYGNEVMDTLELWLSDVKQPEPIRREITRVLRKMPSQPSVDILVAQLPAIDAGLRYAVIKALSKLRARGEKLSFNKDEIAHVLRTEAQAYYTFRRIGVLLRDLDQPGIRLLRRLAEERQDHLLERIFRLLGLHYPPDDIYSAHRGLTSQRRAIRASAVEFLENVLDSDTRALLLPVLDEDPSERYDHPRDSLGLPPLDTPADALGLLVCSQETFLRATAVYAAAHSTDPTLREAARAACDDDAPEVQHAARQAFHPDQHPTMTTVEKVIVLQDLDLLADVPAEQLQYLAAVAEEVFYDVGDVVYAEEEPADALYVLVNGSVRLLRNEQVITTAGRGEAIGTWALFDESPRVVRAVVAEEARLLRIARDDFFDLLADHVQITQGVLKTVVKRMRSLVERVEAATTA